MIPVVVAVVLNTKNVVGDNMNDSEITELKVVDNEQLVDKIEETLGKLKFGYGVRCSGEEKAIVFTVYTICLINAYPNDQQDLKNLGFVW